MGEMSKIENCFSETGPNIIPQSNLVYLVRKVKLGLISGRDIAIDDWSLPGTILQSRWPESFIFTVTSHSFYSRSA